MFVATGAVAAGKLRFWNQTTSTIVELYLAPAGTEKWGPNQCENDKDKAVDGDERLQLTGVAAGRYDVKLVEKSGRRCLVRDVELKADGPYAFALAEEDLKDCKP
ncbi:hypothetical protein GCM10011611_18910 [Aliidongia dinghuensis]|uniref:Uncharacterized protein n=2 Tax=Aliidongia dinghuensis TaxID=1867774 RepID=A0A8J3E4C8_9PROT|nr:hypothetical protein GCM10011611_18910 [Aliidongia dinghuensis]